MPDQEPIEPIEPVEPVEPTEPVLPEEPAEEDDLFNPEDVTVEVRGVSEKKPVDYGEDIDPDDIKTISTVVEKQREQDRSELQAIKDDIEVNSFLQSKPEFQKYKPAILKYMQYVAPDGSKPYGNIPVKNIAAIVASNDLMKLGAKAEREAQAKADATKLKANPVRKPAGGAADWASAPKEAVEEQIRKVKSGQFN